MAGLCSLGISIAMNEVNSPGPGREESIWLERDIECLRFIKFDYTFMSIWFPIVMQNWYKRRGEVVVMCNFGKALLCLSNSIKFRNN